MNNDKILLNDQTDPAGNTFNINSVKIDDRNSLKIDKRKIKKHLGIDKIIRDSLNE